MKVFEYFMAVPKFQDLRFVVNLFPIKSKQIMIVKKYSKISWAILYTDGLTRV